MSAGSGRPKGSLSGHTLENQEARKLAVSFVHKRLLPMLEAMYLKVLDGDVAAFNSLMDRAWGKAVQGVELTGANGNPIVFMPLELIQKHALPIIEGTPQIEGEVKDVTPNEG